MEAATISNDKWAQCDEDYRMRLNIIARPLIPEYLEAKSNTTSEEEPDQDGDVDMSHAENKDVRSNEPGKLANNQDCAEAS